MLRMLMVTQLPKQQQILYPKPLLSCLKSQSHITKHDKELDGPREIKVLKIA